MKKSIWISLIGALLVWLALIIYEFNKATGAIILWSWVSILIAAFVDSTEVINEKEM
ncbi:MAG: hypothetical protein K0S61_85 [Anaerocolumna sp.]|jgi:hypothetical protein|nr:hypothetical protein [Anaerocolumna sp.]